MTAIPPAASTADRSLVGHGAHSCDEFTQLREVVVGDPSNARIPTRGDVSMWTSQYSELTWEEMATVRTGALPKRIIEETDADLEALVATLRDLGVVVHRPAIIDHAQEFATPDWCSDGFYSYCPRDITLIIDSTIIETPSPTRARYFELNGLKDVFQRCMTQGSAWISAPKPRLLDQLFGVGPQGLPVLGELEPAFDAANVLRLGRDLLYLVSCSGNELGRQWLENVLRAQGDTYRVHPLRGLYDHTHIDTTISVLRPGLVVLNPARISEATVPDLFRGWDIIWCPTAIDTSPTAAHPLGSAWLGMNLLMINPQLAIVDAAQHELIRQLQRHGIEVLPHTLRHSRVLGGGFHCATLDLVRDGEPISYFD